MNGPSLTDQFGAGESSKDDKITDAIIEDLSTNDKIIEIRPVDQSNGMGLKRLLLLGAGALGLAYWARNSQKPDELIGSVKEKTTDRTQQAAETIKEESENASTQIEEGSERAGEAVQKAGEEVSERTEEAGEKAGEEAESDAKDSLGP